jgi:hypothetical protein
MNANDQTPSLPSTDSALTDQDLTSVAGGSYDLVKILKDTITVVSRALRHPIVFTD